MSTFFILLFIFLILYVLVLTYWYNNLKPRIKGWIGERVVISKLKRLGNNYKIFNDIYIHNAEGNTVQIDHIVLSKFGLFVIETKNFKGWVFGNDFSEKWTVQIYKSKRKFPSPIRQNYSHVKALQDLLESNEVPIVPIVCFTNNATIKSEFKSNIVITTSQLKKAIKAYDKELIPLVDVDYYEALIEDNSLVKTRKLKRSHIKQLKKVHG